MGHAVALAHVSNIHSLNPVRHTHAEKFSLCRDQTKILFVTPEFSDLVKAGGLGDVSAALPQALSTHHDVRVLIPGYREVLAADYEIETVGQLDGYAALPACSIGKIELDNGVIVYVLLCDELYGREGTPYGDSHGKDWDDNHIRFARLGLAAAQIAENNTALNWCPDLVHAHDWPAALAPAYMAWRGQTTPSVFTIHNLAHQGLYDFSCSTELGLPPEVFGMESMEFYGKLSFLKAGIVYSSYVTTVSKTYAREITTPAFGCGLEGLLKLKFEQGLLSGITNGIDESWQPASDPYLMKGFCANQWQHKRENIRYVEDMFDLNESCSW
jgi:starch synthase